MNPKFAISCHARSSMPRGFFPFSKTVVMFFRHMDGLTISRATTGKTVRGRPRSSVTVYVFDSVECKHVSICKTFAKHCVHCRCLKVCDYFDIAFRYIYLFTIIWTMCNLMSTNISRIGGRGVGRRSRRGS